MMDDAKAALLALVLALVVLFIAVWIAVVTPPFFVDAVEQALPACVDGDTNQ